LGQGAVWAQRPVDKPIGGWFAVDDTRFYTSPEQWRVYAKKRRDVAVAEYHDFVGISNAFEQDILEARPCPEVRSLRFG
jgi:hypothetical protein